MSVYLNGIKFEKKNCSATEIAFVAKQLFLSISDELFFKFCGLNQL